MTGRFGLRREAEAFAAALDCQARDAVSAGSSTDHARLLDTVDMLTRVPAPRMDPTFSALLRERLVAEAEELLAATADEERLRLPESAPRTHRRRVASVAAALVVVGSTAGVAAAAQSAAPGDALYGVKRGLERVQTDLTPGDVRRGNAYLDQAADRLTETRKLLTGDEDARDSALVEQTLDAFTTSVQQGSDLVLRGFQRDSGARDDVVRLRSFSAQSLSDLTAMRAGAPAGSGEAFARAADAVASADQHAVSLCQTCGGSALTLPASLIQAGPPAAFKRLLAAPAAAPPVLPVSTIGGDKQAIAAEADKADKAAKDAPPASPSPSTPDSTAPAPTAPTVPGVDPGATTPAEQLLKSLTTDTLHTTQTITTPLLAAVKGTTDGLGQLTGGLTTPLTDPVNGLLEGLTGQQ